MNSLSRIRCFRSRLALLLSAWCLLSSLSHAQPPAAGIIEGRVFNPGTGECLEFVRVPVAGGQAVRQDFELVYAGDAVRGPVIKLDEFVVSTSKEMDGAA